MIENQMVRVLERIQAGDVFLFRFKCPMCHSESLTGFPFDRCEICKVDLSGFEFSIGARRLLCGTERKHRIGKKMIQKLRNMWGDSCAYCLRSLSGVNYHVEHIIPLCVGGNNRIENLVLSCPQCNSVAGGKFFFSFQAKKSYILKQRNIVLF